MITQLSFMQLLFLLASFIAAIGLIIIVYSRSARGITPRLFIITLLLVIFYLISHTVHFVFMPALDVTLLDQSCHSFLIVILLSLTFFTLNYPEERKVKIAEASLMIVPTVILLILIWRGDIISMSHARRHHFAAEFTSLYWYYIVWYIILILISFFSLINKLRKSVNPEIRKQLLFLLFGLILTNTATFIFGILLPWILGFYYLVEVSPLAFLVGFISFSAIAIGKYNMFPSAFEKVNSFSLNKKIFFSALVLVPIIILLIQIPIGRIIFGINSSAEMIRFFLHSLFIGLIVGLSLSILISKIIAQPVTLLREKVVQIENGDFDARSNIVSADEIGELSHAFNSMASTISRNISELKLREARIKTLLNAFEKSLAGIAIVDQKYRPIEVNSQFNNLIGKSDNSGEMHTIEKLQFTDNEELFENIISEVNSKNSFFGEIQIRFPGNENAKYLLLSVTKIFNDEKEHQGYLFVEIDITDRKNLEAKIVRSEKFAALGKMSAVLAHEIKTPLTSIKMNADILADTLNLSSEDSDSLRIISKETTRLAELVNEVLQFSRSAQLKFIRVNPRVLLTDAFNIVMAGGKNKNLNFINKVPDFELHADADKLKQVFLNLLRNSAEAVETYGEIEIDLKVEKSRVILVFSDNGRGIVNHEKIFDPFFTTKVSGTGLGLSVSKKIIEQHNGALELISSRPGRTVFEIILPIQNDEQNIST